MNAKELRIGNFVGGNLKEFPDNYFTVVEVAEESAVFTEGLEWHPIRGRQYFNPEDVEPIELTPEWLIKFGFEKKPLYGWKGNGYDYQPETSRTDNQDFALWIVEIQRYFIFRYESCSYRKHESDAWESDVYRSIHMLSDYYERCGDSIPFGAIDYVHQLQNLFFSLTGIELELTK